MRADGSYTFDASSYDSLAAGQTQDVTATYSVSDGQGGTTTGTLVITITGTNDAPVVNEVSTGAVTEDTTYAGTVAGAVTDVDTRNNFV